MKHWVWAACAILGIPAWAQDKTAEETFQRIQDSIDKAKTVTVRFKLEDHTPPGDIPTPKVSVTGTILVKEGNKARIEVKMTGGTQTMEMLTVSNGKRFRAQRTNMSEASSPEQDTPQDLEKLIKGPLIHLSMMSVGLMSSGEPDANKKPVVSNLKTGDADKGAATLTYTLEVGGEPLDIRLWYDPKTLKLLKRTMTGKGLNGPSLHTETLEEYALNAPIPDDKFILPAPPLPAAVDKAAEEAFQKIQDSIDKARTVSVKFKYEGAMNFQKVTASGTILVKDVNKARVEARLLGTEQELNWLMSSDGKKIRIRSNLVTHAPDEQDAYDGFGAGLKRSLMHFSTLALENPSAGNDPVKKFVVSGLKSGDGEKGTKTLSYKLLANGGTMAIRLWYDPRTFKLLKRTMEGDQGVSGTLTETLEEFTLNADIPDDRFTAPAPAADAKAAEEILRKIQETLDKARTVRIKFKIDGVMVPMRYASTGTVLLKDGNRARVEMKAKIAGIGESDSLIVSNGSRIAGKNSATSHDMPFARSVPDQDAPENLGSLLKVALLHSSMLAAGLLTEDLPKGGVDPRKKYAVSELRAGEDNNGAKTLSYKLAIDRDFATMRLWYDPKTFKPLKRSMLQQGFHFNASFLETVEEFVLNGEIPDEVFKLPEPPKDPALVGHWKLDETEGTQALDSSGKGNPGVYVNAPEPSTDVPAMKFADPQSRMFVQGRQQHVAVPDSPSLRLTGSLTVAAWVKPAADTTEAHQGVVERFSWTGTEASGGFSLRLGKDRNVNFNINPASGGPKGCWARDKAPVGAWSHLAGVYDATTQEARAYLNGRLVVTERGVPPPGVTDQPLRLGSDYSQNQFNGSLDDLRLYSRALSEAEVRSLSSGNDR